jgi:hypothetical protein
MRIKIEGKDMTKEDLIQLGKFLTKFFRGRKDLISVLIEEGTQDMTKEECLKMLHEMFVHEEDFKELDAEALIVQGSLKEFWDNPEDDIWDKI